MRSPEDLVRQLDAEAGKFSMVAIVVAFDDTSRFVFHDDNADKMVTDLRSMIELGGEPFGLLGYIATEKGSSVSSFIYDEYSDTVWAKPLMDELVGNMVETLNRYEQRGGSA